MPKVSFIVAVYNSMPYLTQCLDSLRAQTVKDIEIICVNDCSPDNSIDYIKSCAAEDTRIKYFTHDTNKRQGGAWNTGLSMATGDYLCFVDADDWLENDYAEVIMNRESDYDIMCAKHYFRGDVIANNINDVLYERCNKDVCLYLLLHGVFFITNFIRRKFVIDSNFVFLENNMYHDFMTNILYFKTDNITVFEEAGYHYRVDNTSMQRSMNQNSFWGRLDVAIKEFRILKAMSLPSKYKDAIDYHFYTLYNRNTLIRAFYGYTKLPWSYIHKVKTETNIMLPNLKENTYFRDDFKNLSRRRRIPLLLFEYCPALLVTIIHLLYLGVRNIFKIEY